MLELKNLMNGKENAIKSIYNRIDETEDRISELEGRNFEIIQSE